MKENNPVKIVHFADTHLGFSAYRKVDADGVNQREKDIYNSFIKAVDYIIKSKPDIVIHAGDLFDNVRPTNRAISVALEQLLRLSRASIPTVIISGNHETPKLRETGHIFRLFEHLKHIYPVYKDSREVHYFNIKGKRVALHAIPHCRNQDDFSDALKEAEPDDSADYNILVTHGAVKSIREFSMNEFNEYTIPLSLLEKKFDYVALGHYHKHVIIQDKIAYSGSLERLSFSEAKDEKGIVEVLLSPKSTISFHPFETRDMIDFEPIDCKDLSIKDILKNIERLAIKTNKKGAILRISLLNLDQSTYRSLDLSSIKNLFPDPMHLEIRHTTTSELEDLTFSLTPAIGELIVEFEKFVNRSVSNDKKKEVILQLGKNYIKEVQTEREEK